MGLEFSPCERDRQYDAFSMQYYEQRPCVLHLEHADR
jgi:hypothetical protein